MEENKTKYQQKKRKGKKSNEKKKKGFHGEGERCAGISGRLGGAEGIVTLDNHKKFLRVGGFSGS